LNSLLTINGTDLIELPITEFDLESLKNKIFLVGYVGPDDEDMYKTPLRFLNKDSKAQNQPDTYGLVIIANQIRTLLDKNTN
jgi:CHASE2 domain-containing sensor protein